MRNTTELNVVREFPQRFTWGKVTKFHEIGPYTIVEYTDRFHQGVPAFHVYVDGECTSSSASTLEGALILAIAKKHLEANEARYMAMAACKLMGIPEE